MNVKCNMLHEDNEEFPWDKKALDSFKNKINKLKIKCRMDDIFLLGFLRARKYDQEKSLQLLMNYYSRRIDYPKFFKDLVPSKVEHVLSMKCFNFLPKPNQEGRYIFICEPGKTDVSMGTIEDFLRAILLFYDFLLNFHRTQEKGLVFIINAEGLTLRHIFQCSPRVLNSFESIFKDSYQLRVKEIHYININIILKTLLSFSIAFFPEKLKKRIHLHNDMSSLHKYIHPEYLPAEFGGELPNYDATEAIELLKDNEELFRENEEYLKLYKDAVDQKFIEGNFRYTNQNNQNNYIDKFLQSAEMKFKNLKEDTENYLSTVDKEFEITHL